MSGASLVSVQNHVETPFIIVQIGKHTFGHCEKSYKNALQTHFNITYPNYLDSLNVTKINGAINTYVLQMTYGITANDDPNRLEKVFSSISKTRTIVLKYGDWEAPSYIYKEEEAIITKLTTKVDLKRSAITYTINCTSAAVAVSSSVFNFPAKKAKPSDVLLEILKNQRYGLSKVFRGMSNISAAALQSLIVGDDKEVQLEAKNSISVLDYISYLVSCMTYYQDSDNLKTCCYYWSIYDDVQNKFGGPYFKVIKVSANTSTHVSYNTYEVDIGYPSGNYVMDFTINNDDSWSLLYDYAQEISLPTQTYHIDDNGHLVEDTTSLVTLSAKTFQTTEETRNWWSKMTQFPITAVLVIKGLLRPAMLMSYVKVNTYFYGHKHTSSGLYIITKQEDSINGNGGYRTTLTLTRVGGDENYV